MRTRVSALRGWVYFASFVVSSMLGAAQRPGVVADDIFRQYDIRGIVGAQLPVDGVYDLARAIAYYFKQHGEDVRTIAVGADGRIHSAAILKKVCAALQDSGFDVLFVGRCPTPVLNFALHTLPVQAGLMITASHNPQEYNGIKIMLHKEPVWGECIEEIKQIYKAGDIVQGQQPGAYRELPVVQHYIEWLSEHFTHLKNNTIPVVIDCGNGAAGYVLPGLCKKMNWPHVRLLYPEVDGTYPHHTADPTVLDYMDDLIQDVTASDALLGMGLDGDCDRMAAVTKSGKLIIGDQLLSVFAKNIIKNGAPLTVVFDIKCSSGLPELLDAHHVSWQRCPTGNAWVKSFMCNHKAGLGGELSCHLFFADRYFGYDDGIYAMMRLMEIIIKENTSLELLLAEFPQKCSSPEIRFACNQQDMHAITEHLTSHFSMMPGVAVLTIDGVHVTFEGGWGIVRPSNTQPVLSARFEADTSDELASIKQAFIKALAPFFDTAYLHNIFDTHSS